MIAKENMSMPIRTPGSDPVSIEPAEHPTKEVPSWQLAALLAVVAILTFPKCVLPWGAELDKSWMIGLHEASERGLVHGRDIGFTYGPLGYLFYPLNAGEPPVWSTCLLLAVYATWWASVALVATQLRGTAALALFALGTLTSGLMCQQYYPGVVYIPLLAATGFFVGAHAGRRPWWAVPGVIMTAVATLGKFNVGVACLGSLLVYLALGLLRVGMRRALLQGALLLGLFAATLTLLFRISNGPISYLGNYLRACWLMGEGYSAQMTLNCQSEVQWLLLVGGVALCLLAPLRDRRAWRSYAPALFILSFPLFASYKSAFVRCDFGHLVVNLIILPAFLCLLLPAELSRRSSVRFRRLIMAVSAASLLITTIPETPEPGVSLSFLFAGPSNLARLIAWGRAREPFRRAFEAFRDDQALATEFRSLIGDAPVDVYPWDIALIAANRLNWDPRYVLQSYQAFHPALDALGAEHYRGPRAPRFVLYRYEAIDNQHPCLVDPRTWLEIYRWYDPVAVDRPKDLLLLGRRSAPRFGEPRLVESRTIEPSQELVLPRSGDGLWFLEADLGLNPLGKLEGQLYKVNPPLLRIDYDDGGFEHRRLVWKNLAGGALVSDLPRDLGAATAALAGGRPDRVRSLTFLTSRRAGFNKNIKIKLFKINCN